MERLPEELKLRCHKTDGGSSFGSVYRQNGLGKTGSYDDYPMYRIGKRKIRDTRPKTVRYPVREAALIQTFPKTYKFFADEQYVAITKGIEIYR